MGHFIFCSIFLMEKNVVTASFSYKRRLKKLRSFLLHKPGRYYVKALNYIIQILDVKNLRTVAHAQAVLFSKKKTQVFLKLTIVFI